MIFALHLADLDLVPHYLIRSLKPSRSGLSAGPGVGPKLRWIWPKKQLQHNGS